MLFASLFSLARQKYYWSPSRFFRILWAVASHIRQQFRIFRVLALPHLQGLVFIDPRIPFKYLSRDYLARGLTVSARANCFLHHYRFLQSRFPRQLLRQALHRDVPLFDLHDRGSRFSISMGLSRTEVREGELFLQLKVDGVLVYSLQFTIVPGWVVQSTACNVLLLSRLQGMKGCYAQVRAATRAFRDVAPPALLVAALKGIAQAFDIPEFAAVCATRQFSYTEESSADFLDAYDRFFTELGAVRSANGFFSAALPLEDKPVELIRNGHKSRTRKKRAYKLEIADRVCQVLRESS